MNGLFFMDKQLEQCIRDFFEANLRKKIVPSEDYIPFREKLKNQQKHSLRNQLPSTSKKNEFFKTIKL